MSSSPSRMRILYGFRNFSPAVSEEPNRRGKEERAGSKIMQRAQRNSVGDVGNMNWNHLTSQIYMSRKHFPAPPNRALPFDTVLSSASPQAPNRHYATNVDGNIL